MFYFFPGGTGTFRDDNVRNHWVQTVKEQCSHFQHNLWNVPQYAFADSGITNMHVQEVTKGVTYKW